MGEGDGPPLACWVLLLSQRARVMPRLCWRFKLSKGYISSCNRNIDLGCCAVAHVSMQPSPDRISPEEVRLALGTLLQSPAFRDAPQMRAFLSYVVNETLEGRCAALKGYTIATMALGRPDDFDPQIDPIVRVQAGRVRQALNDYHVATPDVPVIIQLDKGNYAPRFLRQADIASHIPPNEIRADHPGGAPHPAPKIHFSRLMMGASATVLAMIVLMAAWILWPRAPVSPAVIDHRASMPQILVEGANPGSLDAYAFVSRVRNAIARFDDVVTVQENHPDLQGPALLAGSENRRHLVLGIALLPADEGRVRVAARLLDKTTQRQIWSREYEKVALDAKADSERTRIVQSIATTLAQPYGVIHAHVRAGLPPGTHHSDAYGCLVEAFDYWLTNDATSHESARDCLMALVLVSPQASAAHAQLTYLHLEEFREGYNPLPGDPRSRALESARAAVRTGPASARAHQALLAAHFARHEMAEAWRAAGDAMELNPYDTEILADVGARHVQSGQFETGLKMLEEALELNSSPPTWATAFRAISLYMLGRLDEAAALAKGLEGATYAPAMLAMVLSANYQKDMPACLKHYAQLRERHPLIVADPIAYMKRLNFDPAMITRIMSSFDLASGCAATP